jgi:SAM-dependent methyltransferase
VKERPSVGRSTLPASYFEDLYRNDPDPWRFASSAYEHRKYAATLAVLRPSYAAALEIGCSIGMLTSMLAKSCRSLLAVDAALQPLAEARRRCHGLANVRFAQMILPQERPRGQFDLVVLSEVLYYFDALDLESVATAVQESLRPNADIVLVHWTGPTNYPLSGDDAAERFISYRHSRPLPR